MTQENPYTPDYDRIPPVFAGREGEMSVLKDLANDPSAGRRSLMDHVLVRTWDRGEPVQTLGPQETTSTYQKGARN